MLEDIVILIGGIVISEEKGYKFENVGMEYLGFVEKIIVDKDNIIIVNGSGDESQIQVCINQIKQQIEVMIFDYDWEKLQECFVKLLGGVVVLYVGVVIEVEMKEKKDCVDDVLYVICVVVEEGIVVGGGVVLVCVIVVIENMKGNNEDEIIGI